MENSHCVVLPVTCFLEFKGRYRSADLLPQAAGTARCGGTRCLQAVITSHLGLFQIPGMSARLKRLVERAREQLGLSAINQGLLTCFNYHLVEKLPTTGSGYLMILNCFQKKTSATLNRLTARHLEGHFMFQVSQAKHKRVLKTEQQIWWVLPLTLRCQDRPGDASSVCQAYLSALIPRRVQDHPKLSSGAY